MNVLSITIKPHTAFATPIKGDTLFGQVCWAIVHRFGEDRLKQLLEGYLNGQPFLVCSDAFPQNYLPKPVLPVHLFEKVENEDRKQVKKRKWISLNDAQENNLPQWLQCSITENSLVEKFNQNYGFSDKHKESALLNNRVQPHNSIHRLLNTTTSGDNFAPYSSSQSWFASALRLQLWLVFDESRISADDLVVVFTDIGYMGYGRDASIGLGKYTIEERNIADSLPCQANADCYLNLAPMAPQSLGFDPKLSYYEPFTRFGRHGDRAVLAGKPFKTPILMADSGGIFTPKESIEFNGFLGQGLGGLAENGKGILSNALVQTVHQGYAPCIGLISDF